MPSGVTKIKLAVKFAWWVRPALAIVAPLDRVQPSRTDARVAWIVDHGMSQRSMFE